MENVTTCVCNVLGYIDDKDIWAMPKGYLLQLRPNVMMMQIYAVGTHLKQAKYVTLTPQFETTYTSS